MLMEIVDLILSEGEYYTEIIEKNTIYLHHTAGSHRPDFVINGWESDDTVDKVTGKKTPYPVATAYIIGGLSIVNNDNSYDGKIYRAFDDKYWAHHLGTTFNNNRLLNKQSVAVEICNYGPLTLSTKDNNYYNYVNSVVPPEHVIKLDKPFKGFIYYHVYTDKQIAATKEFILAMKAKHPKIELKTPLLTVEGFEMNENAKAGVAGVYSHTNVLATKFDLSPQPKLIKMLKEILKPQ
jgi:hypothetical protein